MLQIDILENGDTLTYSDEGFFIIQDQTGIEYQSAYDVKTSKYTYTETDKEIEKIEEKQEQENVQMPFFDKATLEALLAAYND